MSGAGVSKNLAEKSAAYLLKEGYNVLVLGFYKWKGMPKEMYSIPVEYVERATKWLLSNDKYTIEKVAIMGISTGSGYALLCASYISDISCVIALSPFDFVMEGVNKYYKPQQTSVYTYKGCDNPYSSSEILNKGILKLLLEAKRDKKYTLKRAMRSIYDSSPLNESSRIKVENMKAKVLFLAAKNDDCWPSDEAVPRMVKVLQNANYPYEVKSMVYEKASHILGYLPIKKIVAKLILPCMLKAEHQYYEQCELARNDSVKQILLFLQEW